MRDIKELHKIMTEGGKINEDNAFSKLDIR